MQDEMEHDPYAPSYESSEPVYSEEKVAHSGFGIASFVMSLIQGVIGFLCVIVAGVMEAKTEGGIQEESGVAVAIGCGIILIMLMSVISFILGIIGLFQRDKQKVFAILGVIFSGLIVFGFIGLMIIGVMVG